MTLWIEHEAATESVDLVVIGYGGVALAPLHRLHARVRNTLPDDRVTVDLGADDLTASIEIEATDQVHTVTDRRQRSALTRRRLPLALEGNANLQAEALTLLHALDEVLQTAHKLVDELVLGDVIGWISRKLLCLFLVARLCVFVNELRLRARVLDPL